MKKQHSKKYRIFRLVLDQYSGLFNVLKVILVILFLLAISIIISKINPSIIEVIIKVVLYVLLGLINLCIILMGLCVIYATGTLIKFLIKIIIDNLKENIAWAKTMVEREELIEKEENG